MKLRGFTIFEVLMSFTIMFIIAAATIPLLFKKAKKPVEVHKPTGIYECSCENNSTGTCEFESKEPERNEFYTVQILGGGAGGGTGGKGGGAGEAKVLYLPAMKDKYEIVLGKGGGAGNNGGATFVYSVDKETNAKYLLDYARGGITSNEQAEVESDAQGAVSTFSEHGCGKGGDAGGSGKMGEVIIRW